MLSTKLIMLEHKIPTIFLIWILKEIKHIWYVMKAYDIFYNMIYHEIYVYRIYEMNTTNLNLSPRSDLHLISSYSITAKSFIKIMRITNDCHSKKILMVKQILLVSTNWFV